MKIMVLYLTDSFETTLLSLTVGSNGKPLAAIDKLPTLVRV